MNTSQIIAVTSLFGASAYVVGHALGVFFADTNDPGAEWAAKWVIPVALFSFGFIALLKI